MWNFVFRYVLPALPGIVTSVFGYIRKQKAIKEDQKKAQIVEESLENQPEPLDEPKQIEIIQRREYPHHPNLKWKRRAFSELQDLASKGKLLIVVHHTGTDYTRSTWAGIANYAISKECHLNPGIGAPYIPYHFGIDLNGVYQFNDIEDITWSVLGYNKQSINISILGNFPTAKGNPKAENTIQPLHKKQLILLIEGLCFQFPGVTVKTHRDLGKYTCPGDELYKLLSPGGDLQLLISRLEGGQIG